MQALALPTQKAGERVREFIGTWQYRFLEMAIGVTCAGSGVQNLSQA